MEKLSKTLKQNSKNNEITIVYDCTVQWNVTIEY